MFGINFDTYTTDELIKARVAFAEMGVKLIHQTCSCGQDICDHCPVRHLCDDIFAAALNIQSTINRRLIRKTRD